MAGAINVRCLHNMEAGVASEDGLIGKTKLDPRAQLETLFPKLKGNLGLIEVQSLALGCDRHQNISDIDSILLRGGIYIRQSGYQNIFELAEPKAVGDSLFLEAIVYLVNGFEAQHDTIGVAVGKFFKAAIEDDGQVRRAARWKEQGYEVFHYMAAGKCPKNAKFVVLATLARKKP